MGKDVLLLGKPTLLSDDPGLWVYQELCAVRPHQNENMALTRDREMDPLHFVCCFLMGR